MLFGGIAKAQDKNHVTQRMQNNGNKIRLQQDCAVMMNMNRNVHCNTLNCIHIRKQYPMVLFGHCLLVGLSTVVYIKGVVGIFLLKKSNLNG